MVDDSDYRSLYYSLGFKGIALLSYDKFSDGKTQIRIIQNGANYHFYDHI